MLYRSLAHFLILSLPPILPLFPPGFKPHMWCEVSDRASALHAHSHTHTLTITCTCCYDVINGIQNLKICSHADSLVLFLPRSILINSFVWCAVHDICAAGSLSRGNKSMLFVLMRLAELENNLPDEAVEGTTAEWQEWSSAVQKLMVSAPLSTCLCPYYH